LKEENRPLEIDEIKEVIVKGGIDEDNQDKDQVEDDEIDFLEFYEDIRSDFKRKGNYHRWKNYGTVLNKLRSFWTKGKLNFEDLDVSFLRKFEVHLMDKYGNKPNTVENNMKKIRKVYNDAIREGLVSRDLYPFRDYTMPSNPVAKAKLSTDEIKKIEKVTTKKGTRLWDSQNIFLFAYYCRGMRFGDVMNLKWKKIKDGRLTYITLKNGKRISMKLLPQAKRILARYGAKTAENGEHFVFPFLDHRKVYANSNKKDYTKSTYFKRQVSSKNALVNKNLKKLQKKAKIEENLSFHISRHSFAQLAHENDLRLTEIQELLGHSDIKTTMTYLKSLGEDHLDSTVEGLFN
jgi:site-specific recombinase XerD